MTGIRAGLVVVGGRHRASAFVRRRTGYGDILCAETDDGGRDEDLSDEVFQC